MSTRSVRVVMLLMAVFVMSAADYVMTMTYAASVGMTEVNPVARELIERGDGAMLGLWKFSTLGLGLCILYRLRFTGKGEIGAWVCFAALAALTVHWARYTHVVQDLTPAVASLAASDDPGWVILGRGGRTLGQ